MTQTTTESQFHALSSALATRLRDAKEQLVQRWLDRICARVAVEPSRIFPTEELLDHVPLLIDGIARYLEEREPASDPDVPFVAKARELGALRHAQGFDAYEVLKEHEILNGIVFAFLTEAAGQVEVPATRQAMAACWNRVSHAIELIRQATMVHFLRLAAARVHEREERLRRFNRMVSHELKNHVGAIRGAAALLSEPWLEEEQRGRFRLMVAENAEGMDRVLENLISLSQLESDSRQRRNVLLPQAAAEAARQLRRAAQSRGVTVRLAKDLPPVEVDAAAVELCLTNYLSNAIKYSDRDTAERWVEISASLQYGEAQQGGELVVRVRDNGIGIPVEARPRLYEQFYRAHGEVVTGVEGTGLGLSIVRETAESLGGRAWAEFPEEGGTVFAFSLPSRRAEDAAAAGVARREAAGGRPSPDA